MRHTAMLHVPNELLDARDQQQLIVCVGPRLARDAGLPGRAELALTLLASAETEGRSLDAATLRTWIADGRAEDALEALARRMGARFGRVVERELAERERPVPALAHAIAALEPWLRAVYTTGLDRLLERAFADAWPSFATAQPDLARRSKVIVKLCGTLEFPETWALTRAALERELGERSLRRALLSAAYRAHCLLFVGFELGDSLTERLFAAIDASSEPTQLPVHFVALDECTVEQRVQLEQRGLSVVHGDALELLAALRGGGSSPRAATSQDLPACPYPGIHAFDQGLAAVFHGRRAEVSAAASRLGGRLGGPAHRHRRWLAIEGSSGVGKSSFVHAGVVPALRRGFAEGTPTRWLIASMRPGRRPLHALIEALALALLPGHEDDTPDPSTDNDVPSSVASVVRAYRPPNSALLLIADQLEELVTLSDADERSQFAACLTTLLEQQLAYVITTMRSDFGAGLSTSVPALARLLNDAADRYTLAPMSRIGLRAAIAEPAAQLGVRFEPELVERIAGDAEQHLGRRTTDEGGIVRTDDAALPLVAHVLRGLWDARAGDDGVIQAGDYEALGGVSGALSRSADALLAGLDARQRAQTKTLLLRMVNLDGGRLTRRSLARLEALTLAGGGVEGERLLQLLSGGAGPRLLVVRSDADVPIVDLVHEALLREWDTLHGWIAADRVQLARDEALARRAAAWVDQGHPWRSLPRGPERRELLRGRVHGAGAVQQRAYQQAMRRAAWVRGGGWVGGVTVVVGLGVASQQYANELAAQNQQVAGERDAIQHKLTQDERKRNNTEKVGRLLAENQCNEAIAVVLEQLPTEEALLVEALDCSISVVESARLAAPSPVTASFVTADGSQAWLGRADGAIERWDLHSHAHTPIVELTQTIDSIAVAPAGDRVAVGSNGQIRLFDGAGTSIGDPFNGVAPRFWPDGARLVSKLGDKHIELHSTLDSSLIWPSDDDQQRTLVGFDFATAESLVFIGHAANAGSVIQALAVDTGTSIDLHIQTPSYLRDFSIAPDQRTIATIADDHIVRLWSAQSGEALDQYPHTMIEKADAFVEFSPLGNYLVFGTPTNPSVMTAALAPANLPGTIAHSRPVSNDERWWSSRAPDGSLRLYELSSGAAVGLEPPYPEYASVWTGADGHHGMLTTLAGSATHWRLSMHDHWRDPSPHAKLVYSLAFTDDGPLTLLSGSSSTLITWQLDRRESQSTKLGVVALAGGTRGLVLTRDGAVIDWPTTDDEPIASVCAPSLAAFDSSGSGLVVACDGGIELWQLSGDSPQRRGRSSTTTPNVIALSDTGVIALAHGNDIELFQLDADGSLVPEATLTGHTNKVTALRFDAGGRLLASGSNDDQVRIWRFDIDWRLIAPLDGLQENIESIAISHNAEWLAAGDQQGRIVVWKNQEIEYEFDDCDGHAVTALAISRTGDHLAAGCNRQVHAWPLTHAARIEFACLRLAASSPADPPLPRVCTPDE